MWSSFAFVNAGGLPIGRGAFFWANNRLTEDKLLLSRVATAVRDNPWSKCMLRAMRFSAGLIRGVDDIGVGSKADEEVLEGTRQTLWSVSFGPARSCNEKCVGEENSKGYPGPSEPGKTHTSRQLTETISQASLDLS